MIELSIIIVAFKNYKIVLNLLESINKYNDLENRIEIIIVDNSPDHIVIQKIEENNVNLNRKYNIKLIKNKNKGFGEGNNVGFEKSNGKYILFLNPDTILCEPIFKYAIERFKEDFTLALFGVKLVDEFGKPNLSFYLSNGGGLLRAVVTKVFNRLDFYISKYMYISGANLFVNSKDFFEAGKFDENIFLDYEEPDLIFRIKKNGKKIKYFPEKKIIHIEGGTKNNRIESLKRRLDSLLYYDKKYFNGERKSLYREKKYLFIKLWLAIIFGIGCRVDILQEIKIVNDYINKK